MRRGEIYFADLSPTVGSEINKRRPVLIVSNDANNRAGSTVTVLPITSNISRVYPFEVLLAVKESGLPKPSRFKPNRSAPSQSNVLPGTKLAYSRRRP